MSATAVFEPFPGDTAIRADPPRRSPGIVKASLGSGNTLSESPVTKGTAGVPNEL